MSGRPLQFATYFDQHYLPRGLALYRSLARHTAAFELWILCLDDPTFETLTRLDFPNVSLVHIRDLERADPELAATKVERTLVEYFWTCGPAFLSYLFESQPRIELLTYLDADTFLFDSLEPVYAELGVGSVLVIEHRYSEYMRSMRRNSGRFNVSLLVFRRSPTGLACIRRWREQCVAWCYYRRVGTRFGDQGYLDEWPSVYGDELVIAQHKGVGVAPWNLANYRARCDNGRVMLDEAPLLLYHFSLVRRLTNRLYDTGLWRREVRLDAVIKSDIYAPYLRGLFETRSLVKSVGGPDPREDSVRLRGSWWSNLAATIRHRSHVTITPRLSSLSPARLSRLSPAARSR